MSSNGNRRPDGTRSSWCTGWSTRCWNITEPGCVMTWQVTGGREEYQVAAERADDGHINWHCTCPDAIYHERYRNACHCKHVQGIQALLRSAAGEQLPAAA